MLSWIQWIPWSLGRPRSDSFTASERLAGDSTEVQEELRRLQGPASHDFEVQAVRMVPSQWMPKKKEGREFCWGVGV